MSESLDLDRMAVRYLGRRVRHITPRYVVDKCARWLYEHRYTDAPWLTPQAVAILSTALRRTDNGLEYGSGRSTLWFAKRTNSLISVENSAVWAQRISQAIRQQGLSNVRYRYVAADPKDADDPAHADYVKGDAGLSSDSMDYVLVDGHYRDECALRGVEVLKPGGLLIVDNANWFIPHPTRSPASATTVASELWAEFLSRVAHWRVIWTSNGISDTAMWFRTA